MLRPAPTRAFAARTLAVLAAPSTVIYGIVLSGTCLGGLTWAQAQGGVRPQQPSAGLPVSQPTSSQPTSTPATAYVAPPPSGPQRAQITFADSQLTVSARNSSLNQILREISRLTGMKITGGVTDERVFGTYGPAPAAKVLGALLDGTGSNVLIVQSPGDQPAAAPVELVLTPRHGGPTPPHPSSQSFDDSPDTQPDSSPVSQAPFRRGTSDPDQSQPPSAPAPPPVVTPASTDTPAASQDQSPNGVKTPQQIYDQLLKLRQQSQQPQPQ
jgi:hypothetical protein